jgi:hypothetical protein
VVKGDYCMLIVVDVHGSVRVVTSRVGVSDSDIFLPYLQKLYIIQWDVRCTDQRASYSGI